MKKSELRKIIRENIRQIMGGKRRLSEQGGPWIPGSQGQTDWEDMFDDLVQNATNPCRFLCNKLEKLTVKLHQQGGGTGIASTAAGQTHSAMMIAKIQYINFLLGLFCNNYGQQECCECEITISEQVRGGNSLADWIAWFDSTYPGESAKIRARAQSNGRRIAMALGWEEGRMMEGKKRGKQLLREWNFGTWKWDQIMLIDGDFFTGTPGIPNPCGYLDRKITKKQQDLANANPDNPNHSNWISRMNQKLGWWQQEFSSRNCYSDDSNYSDDPQVCCDWCNNFDSVAQPVGCEDWMCEDCIDDDGSDPNFDDGYEDGGSKPDPNPNPDPDAKMAKPDDELERIQYLANIRK